MGDRDEKYDRRAIKQRLRQGCRNAEPVGHGQKGGIARPFHQSELIVRSQPMTGRKRAPDRHVKAVIVQGAGIKRERRVNSNNNVSQAERNHVKINQPLRCAEIHDAINLLAEFLDKFTAHVDADFPLLPSYNRVIAIGNLDSQSIVIQIHCGKIFSDRGSADRSTEHQFPMPGW